jgi:hypothetical protein
MKKNTIIIKISYQGFLVHLNVNLINKKIQQVKPMWLTFLLMSLFKKHS